MEKGRTLKCWRRSEHQGKQVYTNQGGADAAFYKPLCVSQFRNNKWCNFPSDRCGPKHIYVKVVSIRTNLVFGSVTQLGNTEMSRKKTSEVTLERMKLELITL